MKRITVVDSGICNLASVLAAFRRVGAECNVARESEAIRTAEALLLPGVGAFADGMASLAQHGMIAPLRAAAVAGVPVLGICLGMQLLAEGSEEFGQHEGLALVPGRVVRLEPADGARVPNIGWCDVMASGSSRLFRGMAPQTPFYFVHSFHLECRDPADVAATIAFGSRRVVVGVERGNIFGVQFHPEKSQDAGLTVLASFVARIEGNA